MAAAKKRSRKRSELSRRLVIALRKIRTARNTSDRQMALATHVSYAFFKEVMDRGGNPSLEFVEQLADGLEVSVDDLLKPLTNDEIAAVKAEEEALERVAKATEELREVRARAVMDLQEKNQKQTATNVSLRNSYQ